jgi:NADH dehydrogenase
MPHRVVIIGGGFAGLTAAFSFKDKPVEVTLLDRRNFHCFQPLLYQVATGGLSPANIAAPLRGLLRKQKNTKVLLGNARRFDAQRKVVISNLGEHPYDSLLISTGATHAYFGHNEWADIASGLKTMEDAIAIRGKIFLTFERAESSPSPEEQRKLLTFVIVGGGPTGVELAGAIGELAHHTLRGNFRNINPESTRVILIEGEERVLSAYPPSLSTHALASLQHLGVEVHLRSRVKEIGPDRVTYEYQGQQQTIEASVILWGAGVQGSELGRALAEETKCTLDRHGRLKVQPDLTIPGYPEICILGDLASLDQDGKPLPGVAQVAIQMGRYAARLIDARLRGKALKPFRYYDKGSMATIGRGAAVADLGWLRLWGYPAWLAWLFLHIIFLVGFESKILVLIQWAFNYVTRARSARLIADDPGAVRASIGQAT